MHTQTPSTSDEHPVWFIGPLLVNPPLAGGSPSQGLVTQSLIVSLLLVEHAIERTDSRFVGDLKGINSYVTSRYYNSNTSRMCSDIKAFCANGFCAWSS